MSVDTSVYRFLKYINASAVADACLEAKAGSNTPGANLVNEQIAELGNRKLGDVYNTGSVTSNDSNIWYYYGIRAVNTGIIMVDRLMESCQHMIDNPAKYTIFLSELDVRRIARALRSYKTVGANNNYQADAELLTGTVFTSSSGTALIGNIEMTTNSASASTIPYTPGVAGVITNATIAVSASSGGTQTGANYDVSITGNGNPDSYIRNNSSIPITVKRIYGVFLFIQEQMPVDFDITLATPVVLNQGESYAIRNSIAAPGPFMQIGVDFDAMTPAIEESGAPQAWESIADGTASSVVLSRYQEIKQWVYGDLDNRGLLLSKAMIANSKLLEFNSKDSKGFPQVEFTTEQAYLRVDPLGEFFAGGVLRCPVFAGASSTGNIPDNKTKGGAFLGFSEDFSARVAYTNDPASTYSTNPYAMSYYIQTPEYKFTAPVLQSLYKVEDSQIISQQYIASISNINNVEQVYRAYDENGTEIKTLSVTENLNVRLDFINGAVYILPKPNYFAVDLGTTGAPADATTNGFKKGRIELTIDSLDFFTHSISVVVGPTVTTHANMADMFNSYSLSNFKIETIFGIHEGIPTASNMTNSLVLSPPTNFDVSVTP